MHGDVVCFIALYLILWFFLARPPSMPFVLRVAGVDPYDMAAHIASLRVPGDMVTDIESLSHRNILPFYSIHPVGYSGCLEESVISRDGVRYIN